MEIVDIFWHLILNIGQLVVAVVKLGLEWWVLIAWVAWWMFGVNWKKAWEVLGQGAWAPLVLLMIAGALVWSRLDPNPCECLGFMSLPTFWWQLGEIGLVVVLTFCCGWLQGYFGWTPEEINLDPPAAVDHGHGPGHGHYWELRG